MNTLYDRLQPLDGLSVDVSPLWGIMTAHHMVEHLSATMRISNGKLYLPLRIKEEQIPARLAFLYSDAPFEKNLRFAPNEPELLPLRTSDMAAAIALLRKMIDVFEEHHHNNPADKPIHPLFGPLNRSQWIQFHHRHFNHHYAQFNLIDKKNGYDQ